MYIIYAPCTVAGRKGKTQGNLKDSWKLCMCLPMAITQSKTRKTVTVINGG